MIQSPGYNTLGSANPPGSPTGSNPLGHSAWLIIDWSNFWIDRWIYYWVRNDYLPCYWWLSSYLSFWFNRCCWFIDRINLWINSLIYRYISWVNGWNCLIDRINYWHWVWIRGKRISLGWYRVIRCPSHFDLCRIAMQSGLETSHYLPNTSNKELSLTTYLFGTKLSFLPDRPSLKSAIIYKPRVSAFFTDAPHSE